MRSGTSEAMFATRMARVMTGTEQEQERGDVKRALRRTIAADVGSLRSAGGACRSKPGRWQELEARSHRSRPSE